MCCHASIFAAAVAAAADVAVALLVFVGLLHISCTT